MRALAFAFVILPLGALMAGPAAAQNFGPGPYQGDPRSGPPRYSSGRPPQDSERPPYFTDRAPPRRPGEGFEQPPPYRGGPDRGPRYEQSGEDRPDARPGPYPGERESRTIIRRVEKVPPQRPRPPEGGERGARTVWPPVSPSDGAPPRRTSERRPERPAPRNVERGTVSVAEFRELQNRVRELERMLAERHDFRDDRRGPDRPPNVIYR